MLDVRCPHCLRAFVAFHNCGRPDDEASCPHCKWTLYREDWEGYKTRKEPAPDAHLESEYEDDWAAGGEDEFLNYDHGE